ncbi:MAG TPA: tetratricopeptide repeat protein, partial [Planctomycetota bacterium]|nr:tetratricopeptide repeat protein [Planctomycetota bacterium]
VSWALNALVDDHLGAGNPSAAIDLLVDASRLPFDNDTRRAMRVRAAGIAEQSNDAAAAMEMYRSVLGMNPADAETMDKLAALYQAAGKVPELLSLRRQELEHTRDRERRLGLRLEVARLVGEVERLGGREKALRDNLGESPGHDASIEALCALFEATAQHGAEADMLEDQATRLEALSEHERAARLWNRVAVVAEHKLKSADRAIEGYRRVVALTPDPAAFDALARLFVHKGQPAQAVPWLERSLQVAAADRRGAIVLDLARAHLAAHQPDQAIGCLEQYLNDEQPAAEARTLLADLYREAGSWEPLARLLTRGLGAANDGDRLAQAMLRGVEARMTAVTGDAQAAISAALESVAILRGHESGVPSPCRGALEDPAEVLVDMWEQAIKC